MAALTDIEGFVDRGTPEDIPELITEDLLVRLKDAQDFHTANLGTAIAWDNQSMTMWAYRIGKLVKLMNERVYQKFATIEGRMDETESIVADEQVRARNAERTIMNMPDGGKGHGKRSLIEEKALNVIQKIGDKAQDFQEWWDTFKSLMTVVRPGSKGLFNKIMEQTDGSLDIALTDTEVEEAWSGVNVGATKSELYSFLMAKTTGEARERLKAVAGEDGIEALRKIVFWYKGMSDAARENRYHDLCNPERVKKDSDLPAALDKWMVKLREIESGRKPVDPWVKVLAIKRIAPEKTVDIINARDDMSGTDAAAYDKVLM